MKKKYFVIIVLATFLLFSFVSCISTSDEDLEALAMLKTIELQIKHKNLIDNADALYMHADDTYKNMIYVCNKAHIILCINNDKTYIKIGVNNNNVVMVYSEESGKVLQKYIITAYSVEEYCKYTEDLYSQKEAEVYGLLNEIYWNENESGFIENFDDEQKKDNREYYIKGERLNVQYLLLRTEYNGFIGYTISEVDKQGNVGCVTYLSQKNNNPDWAYFQETNENEILISNIDTLWDTVENLSPGAKDVLVE